MLIGPAAWQMIDRALTPLIRSGMTTKCLSMVVAPNSQMSERYCIDTEYGQLPVKVSIYLKKGQAYIIEDPIGRRIIYLRVYKYRCQISATKATRTTDGTLTAKVTPYN